MTPKKNYFSTKNWEKIYSKDVISIKIELCMSVIEAYDIKARKKSVNEESTAISYEEWYVGTKRN